MKVIAISGSIGWDVAPSDVREQLEEAAGEDIEVQVSSAGGLVYDGLEIYNLIRRYPGAVTTRLMGLAASMASYLVMAGDRVIAEDNAVLMVHNARAVAFGDHNAMRKAADIVEGLSRTMARAYERKTGRTREEIAALMDAETFLYGREMEEEGFVDEVVPGPEEEHDRESAVARARIEIEKCEKLVRELEDEGSVSQVAAMLGGTSPPEAPYPNEHSARVRDPGEFEPDSFRRKSIASGVSIIMGRLKGEKTMTVQAYRFDASKFTAEQARKWLKDHNIKYKRFEPARKQDEKDSVAVRQAAAAASITDEEGRSMTLDQLKKEHPDVYQAAVAEGRADGVKRERDRVAGLKKWAEADPACAKIVEEAIANGKTEADVQPQLMVAVRGGAGKPQGSADENPPEVATATAGAGSEGEDDETVVESVLGKVRGIRG